MSFLERVYTKIVFKKYKKLKKINEYYTNVGSKNKFNSLIKRKSNNLDYKFTDYSFSPHNPVSQSDRSIKWICENLHAAFDYLENNKINYKTILEIGCGFGISTWILNDIAEKKITGLDINKEAIDTANYLFNDCEFICSDYLEFFKKNPNIKFDLIISCFGPVKISEVDLILQHCNEFITIGYRAYKSEHFFKWTHKREGKHLSFSTTLITKDRKTKFSLKYFKYYFTWFYLESLLHSIKNRYFIPL